jgi:hypothetical protein
VKILNESAFKKINVLLMCTALMMTCIGSVAASSASESQSGTVIVTSDGVSYNMDQQLSAGLTEDGVIAQAQQSNENVFFTPNGKVQIVTASMSGVQSVDTSSMDKSKNNNPSNEVTHINTKDSGEITLSQERTETSPGDIDQEQSASLRIISTPNDKKHVTLHLKQK